VTAEDLSASERVGAQAIGTLLRCLTPFAKGCGYSLETEADDDNEYISSKTRGSKAISEVDPMKLSAQEFQDLRH